MASLSPWYKPLRNPEANPLPQDAESIQPPSPYLLRDILTWESRWQNLLFRTLLPVDLLSSYGVDPISLTDPDGKPVLRMIVGQGLGSVRLELYHRGDARDALIELELSDTSFGQLEVTWIAMQNPLSPRFDVDRVPDEEATMRGSIHRNIEAETAAMSAGLAPGQIHAGLGAFSALASRLELFMSCSYHREYVAEPLFYHTAVLFERIGFAYIRGHARMQQIDRGFSPGGELRSSLDGSSPFRAPELANTVRGRSWAIHDGILTQSWDRVRMIKRLGVDAGVSTCGDVSW